MLALPNLSRHLGRCLEWHVCTGGRRVNPPSEDEYSPVSSSHCDQCVRCGRGCSRANLVPSCLYENSPYMLWREGFSAICDRCVDAMPDAFSRN